MPMKSLVRTEKLCSRSVPLEHAPGAKSLVCIGLNSPVTFVISVLTPFSSFRRPVVY